MTKWGASFRALMKAGYRGWIFCAFGVTRMALHFKLQLVVATDDDEQISVDELVVLSKDYARLEQLGLTLAEAKALLLEIQRQILSRQIAFLASPAPCPNCGRSRGVKDYKTIVFRTFVRQVRAGEPTAAALSMPAHRASIPEPTGRVSASPVGHS